MSTTPRPHRFPAHFSPAPLALALLASGLTSCALPYSSPTLHFTRGPASDTLDPATLLSRQVIPENYWLSVPEAVRRAPLGSVMVVCWKGIRWDNVWGPCSHMTRKYSAQLLTEYTGVLKNGIGFTPIETLHGRYAVIVLDTPLTGAQLQRVNAEAERLNGVTYNTFGAVGTYYCTTYINHLNQASGLPEAVPLNPTWNAYIPADALQVPGARILYVGVNEGSAR